MIGPIASDALTIRRATRDDVPRVLALIAGGAMPRRPDDEDATLPCYAAAFAEIDANPNQMLVVAELEGRVVGTLQLVTIRHLHRHGGLCAEVEAVHVDTAVRDRGVGSALMRWCIDEAKRRGCYRLQLTSQTVREGAHRFYERLGFTASHRGFKLVLSR